MKYKYISLLIAITCLFFSLLTGCSKTEKSKEIEFLTNRTDLVNGIPDATGQKDPNTAYLKILAEKFEKESGIKIKITAYPDYNGSCRSRFASGDYGDVITLGLQMSDKKKKMLFKPLGNKEEFSDYLFLDKSTIDNEVYGISEGYYVSGVVYNKKVFTDAGYKEFPKTLSDLNSAFAKIKANGKIPIILNRGDGWPLNYTRDLCNNFAGVPSTYNKLWMSNNPFSSNKPMGESLQQVAEWVSKGYTEPEFIKMWEESKTKIANGEAGMMIIQSWILPQIKQRAESIKSDPEQIAFTAFPACNPVQEKRFTFADSGLPFVISKKTKNFEASKKWILYIANSGIFKTQGALPINKNSTEVDPGLLPMLKDINDGSIVKIDAIPANKYEGQRTDEIFKDMDLFTNYAYIGNALDKAKISINDFKKYIAGLNEQFNKVRKDRKY
jgi:raffinose/stachyose/melibiose transport system substrate-binding protein